MTQGRPPRFDPYKKNTVTAYETPVSVSLYASHEYVHLTSALFLHMQKRRMVTSYISGEGGERKRMAKTQSMKIKIPKGPFCENVLQILGTTPPKPRF